MPQQNNPKQRSSKQTKKSKPSKLPFFCIVVLLIAAVITVCMVIKNNQSKEEERKTKNAKNSTTQEETHLPEASLIDMNNTENAKVENGAKENTSSKLAEEKTFKGLTIKDIKLIAQGGETKLTATLENKSAQNFEEQAITVVFTKKDGSEYARLNAMLPSIPSGKTNELNAATSSDLANAYDFTIQ